VLIQPTTERGVWLYEAGGRSGAGSRTEFEANTVAERMNRGLHLSFKWTSGWPRGRRQKMVWNTWSPCIPPHHPQS